MLPCVPRCCRGYSDAMMLAAQHNRVDVMELLIRTKASVNLCDDNKVTPV